VATHKTRRGRYRRRVKCAKQGAGPNETGADKALLKYGSVVLGFFAVLKSLLEIPDTLKKTGGFCQSSVTFFGCRSNGQQN
jgi:hypothetical protein